MNVVPLFNSLLDRERRFREKFRRAHRIHSMDVPAPMDDVWTVQRILTWTTEYLTSVGVEAARLEAELLCAHARECQRIRLYTDYDTPMTEAERARMRHYVQRRAAREPLAYITGKREFYGRDFEVGSGVLIPRPETETLIDLALERIPNNRQCRLFEVGFGSGCIAITLAVQKPNCRITATDISDVCCRYARRNAEKHGVANRIQFVGGDGFRTANQDLVDATYDGVISNPPYVCEHELVDIQREVADHEPKQALVSGADGLDLIRRLIPESIAFLRPGGWFAVECDPVQCSEVAQLMSEAGFTDPKIHRDHRDVDRIVTAVNGA